MKPKNSSAMLLSAILTVGGLGLSLAHAQVGPYIKPAAPATPPGMPAETSKPAVPASPTAAPGSPSMDALQNDLDQKQYPAAVRTASKLLALRGPAAEGLSRFRITMLKGEAQVGMRAMSAAANTFKSALKETKDPHEKALAKWTGELFARAKGTVYVPKTIGAGLDQTAPIDLMDRDNRKAAFGAMLDDDLSALSPKLKSAVVSQNILQIWPVLEQVVSLDQLDVIANGNDDKTTTIASSLLDHSRNLLSNALKGMWARVGDIDNHANYVTNTPTTVVINGQYVTQNVSQKNGLTQSNKNELNSTIATCLKIHDAAEVFLPLAKSDKDWGAILNDADRVAGRASDVLNADYGSATSNTTYDNGAGSLTGLPAGTQQPQFPGNTTTTPQRPTRPTTPRTGTGTGTKTGN
jgi:hypothetical protein